MADEEPKFSREVLYLVWFFLKFILGVGVPFAAIVVLLRNHPFVAMVVVFVRSTFPRRRSCHRFVSRRFSFPGVQHPDSMRMMNRRFDFQRQSGRPPGRSCRSSSASPGTNAARAHQTRRTGQPRLSKQHCSPPITFEPCVARRFVLSPFLFPLVLVFLPLIALVGHKPLLSGYKSNRIN